jgi:hypothetical protein
LSSDGHGSLLVGQIIHSFHEVHLACNPLPWRFVYPSDVFVSIITPPLVGEHILNKFSCFSYSERRKPR